MDDTARHNSTVRTGFWAVAMVVLAPVAFLGLLVSPNKYEAMGESGIDCDGPLGVFIFAVPALLIYLPGSFAFIRSALSTRKTVAAVSAVFASFVALLLAANIARAAWQFQSTYGEVCGTGL